MVPAVAGDASQVLARQDTGGARTGHVARGDDPQRLVQGISIQATVVQFKRSTRKRGHSESHGMTGLRWS
jgi:hypothetical protein